MAGHVILDLKVAGIPDGAVRLRPQVQFSRGAELFQTQERDMDDLRPIRLDQEFMIND